MRLRLLAQICAVFMLFYPAHAGAQELPAPLEVAVADAEQHGRAAPRFAFTLHLQVDEHVLKARFDPARDTPWTLLNAEPLSGELDAIWQSVSSDAEADRDNLVDEPRAMVAGNVRPATRDGVTGYRFDVAASDDNPDMARMAPNLEGFVGLTGGDTRLSHYEITSIRPFKPSPVAKINAFRMFSSFSPLGDTGALVVTLVEQEIEGSAMMRGFEQRVVQKLSEIELRR